MSNTVNGKMADLADGSVNKTSGLGAKSFVSDNSTDSTLSHTALPDFLSAEDHVSGPVEGFLSTCIMYKVAGRDSLVVNTRLSQAITDRRYLTRAVPHRVLYTGDFAGGMPRDVVPFIDTMITFRDYPVVSVPGPPGSDKCQGPQLAFVIAEVSPRRPTHLRLSVRGDRNVLPDALRRATVTQDGLVYLSHREMHALSMSRLRALRQSDLLMVNTRDKRLANVTPCFHCPDWPPCAAEFLSRPRPHSRPPKNLILNLTRTGCHVVGSSKPDTTDKHFEWRWSFSIAEKNIVDSMNSAMFGCMYVLELIRSRVWTVGDSRDQPARICQYHILVACLWANERAPDCDSVLRLTKLVIEWLIQCHIEHHLPHYIIPGENLIGDLSRETCLETAKVLSEVKCQLSLHVLRALRQDAELEKVMGAIYRQISPEIADSEKVAGSIRRQISRSPKMADSEKVAGSIRRQTSRSLKMIDSEKGAGSIRRQKSRSTSYEGRSSYAERAASKAIDDAEIDTSDFLDALLEQVNTIQTLDVVGRISPGGTRYNEVQLGFKQLGDFYQLVERLCSLEDYLPTSTPSALVSVPEEVVLHVIDTLEVTLKVGLHPVYRSTLYRKLGMTFQALAAYITDISHLGNGDILSPMDGPTSSTEMETQASNMRTSAPEGHSAALDSTTPNRQSSPMLPVGLDYTAQTTEVYQDGFNPTERSHTDDPAHGQCLVKAEEYLQKGLPMEYPSGFDDMGLSGSIYLILSHYLNGDFDKVVDMLNVIQTLLDEAKDNVVIVKRLPLVYIVIKYALTQSLWKQDRLLYQNLLQDGAQNASINLFILAYYVQARVGLHQGEAAVAQGALGCMYDVREVLRDTHPLTSADVLAQVVLLELSRIVS